MRSRVRTSLRVFIFSKDHKKHCKSGICECFPIAGDSSIKMKEELDKTHAKRRQRGWMKKVVFLCQNKSQGVIRESNPGPLAPEARIIPLDQSPSTFNNRSTQCTKGTEHPQKQGVIRESNPGPLAP